MSLSKKWFSQGPTQTHYHSKLVIKMCRVTAAWIKGGQKFVKQCYINQLSHSDCTLEADQFKTKKNLKLCPGHII